MSRQNAAPRAREAQVPPAIGRPRALDSTRRATVAMLLAMGCNLKKAAKMVGCAPCTLRREMRRDRGFERELRDARHGAETNFLHTMVQAAGSNPSAADWLRRRLLACLGEQPPPPEANAAAEKTAPQNGSPSAQNDADFCALPFAMLPEFFRPEADQKRAKHRFRLKQECAQRGAKRRKFVPADTMTPFEFVMQERCKPRRAGRKRQ